MVDTHIWVEERDGFTIVRFDDDEIEDWFDDIFTEEHDLECVGCSNETTAKGVFRLRYFDASVSVATLQEIIDAVDANEIQSVWELNNTAEGRKTYSPKTGTPFFKTLIDWFKGKPDNR